MFAVAAQWSGRIRILLVVAVVLTASGITILATQGAGAATQAVTACSACRVGPAQNIEVQRALVGAGPGATTYSAETTNWAGYAVTGATFDSVRATWVQPAVTCQTANSWTVFWVGLDGFGGDTVEQGGSYALCGGVGSTPVYSLWWEMWPTNDVQTVTLSQPLRAGDVIQASVVYDPSTADYTITVEDETTSQTFSEVEACAADLTCLNATAEAVTEAPTMGSGDLFPLANYGAMAYTSASVTDSTGFTGALNAPQWTTYSISENNETPPNYSSVSPLNANGNGFSVTWVPSASNSQTIAFTSTPPPDAVVGGPTYPVTATGGGSGEPVVISIDGQSTGVCSMSGNVVSFTGSGTCIVDANQAGYSLFSAAPQLQQTFAVATAGTPSPDPIASVGTLANKSGTDTTTVAVSPQHVGDLLALAVKVASSSITGSSVAGGGVSAWTRAVSVSEGGNELQIWTGTVSATGSSTVSVTFSGSVASIYTGLAVHEFSASSGTATVWGIDAASGISNTSSTTVTFPKLAPTGTGELYFGYAGVANNAAAGSTSGFSYATTTDADVVAYDTDVLAAVQPTAKQSPAGVSGAAAALIIASPSSSSTTLPGSPAITSVVPGNGQLTVYFTPGSNGGRPLTSFTITCGSVSVSAGGSATSATVSPLSNGTTYSCTVTAWNINGPGQPSTAVTGTPSAVTVAPTIASVGTLANKSGTDTTTLAVSPQHVGDLLALALKVASSSITGSSVSGGGVTAWTRAVSVSEGGNELQIWTGTVSATGSSTVSVTFSGSVASIYTGLAVHEFSASSGTATVWGIDAASGISNTSSTTVTFPKLAPTGTGELYFGYAGVANNAAAGSTSGFSYATTTDADVVAYDTDVLAAVQPTAKQSPAGVSGAAAALITAST